MQNVLRQERWIIGGCLAVLVLLAWLYLFHAKAAMPGMNAPATGMPEMAMPGMDMPGMVMPETQENSAVAVFLLFVMWAVMMVAMMVPSAAPMILTFLSVNQRRRESRRPFTPVGFFIAGYLAVWTLYAAIAAIAQWELHKASLVSSMMVASSPAFSGGLLIAAGVFQWTPLKHACLKGCRSPLTFLMSEWREGSTGALTMGLRHGAYCVGCCWVLMALLFVAGVMNLLWVAVIALFVLAEKILPKGQLVGRLAGIVLFAAGAVILARHR
jgi:predicted metal-binding membrane protein